MKTVFVALVLLGTAVTAAVEPAALQKSDVLNPSRVIQSTNFVAWDTVWTACLGLAVMVSGNMGITGLGGVNMNYSPPLECDTGGNSRGDAGIYLFDGSPVVLRKTDTEIRASWSIFSDGFASEYGFEPVAGFAPPGKDSTNPAFVACHSGTFISSDSLIKVEKTWYAPTGMADSCQFILERTLFFPYDIEASISGLLIGEAVDWDVPSDTGFAIGYFQNVGGISTADNLIYMRGYNAPDTITDCADNSLRYAGMALLNQHYKNCTALPMYGSYYLRNDSFVQISGSFVPSELWDFMKTAGNVAPPYTTPLDLHAVLTFQGGATGITLPANDTLTVWTVLATTYQGGLNDLTLQIDKAAKFLVNHARQLDFSCLVGCCVGTAGNVNYVGIIDGSDLALLVAYLTNPSDSKPTLPCPAEANVNAVGVIDGGDLALLVAYLTNPPESKPPLPLCQNF